MTGGDSASIPCTHLSFRNTHFARKTEGRKREQGAGERDNEGGRRGKGWKATAGRRSRRRRQDGGGN